MISNKIIGGLKPHFKNNINDTSTEYFMIIKDIEDRSINSDNGCKEGVIALTLVQADYNINNFIDADSTTKELIIKGRLDSDEDNIYSVDLIGYERVIKNKFEEQPTFPGTHYIEMIETSLNKEITINFNYSYINTPSVIINIDGKYEGLYKSYTTDYIMETADEYNPNQDTKFVGVKITFNNLKVRKSYPLIKITIIGDLIDGENSTEESSSTTTTPTPVSVKINNTYYSGTITDGELTIPSKHIFVDGETIPIVINNDSDISEETFNQIALSSLENKTNIISELQQSNINGTYSGKIINGKAFVTEACNDLEEGDENNDNSNSG